MSEQHEETMRDYLKPERQDEQGYLTPQTVSQLAGLSDDEVQRLYRKLSHANQHPWERRLELELIGRVSQSP